MTPDTWDREYAAAWQRIADGLGFPFNEHLSEARLFVGDRALLDLMHRFEPAEVIVACGIGIAALVLHDVVGQFSNRHRPSRLEREVRAAHDVQARTTDGQAFVEEIKSRRDEAERGFLKEAADDARIGQMRQAINDRRVKDGLLPL
jgi:hypothetical protein